jgi:O-acetyl-ADP-ribose deacetylase (regulator of RNase III)
VQVADTQAVAQFSAHLGLRTGDEQYGRPPQSIRRRRCLYRGDSVQPLRCGAEAIILSANNTLKAGSGWPYEAELKAGPSYIRECQELARSAGPNGLARGTAVVTSGGQLRRDLANRRIIQAITVVYGPGGNRTPADTGTIYTAVRAGLEKAEVYRASSVATYLMAQQPGYGASSPDDLALSLCLALLDHAAISSSIRRLMICEEDQRAFVRAATALRGAIGRRY